jgi:heme exporter protein B
MRFLSDTFTVLLKDLRIGFRLGYVPLVMLFFSCLCLALFAFAFGDYEGEPKEFVHIGLWMTILFMGTLCCVRTFERERREGCLDLLMLSPLSPAAIYLAKVLENLIFMFAVEIPLLIVIWLFFDVSLGKGVFELILVLFLGSFAFSLVATLFSFVIIKANQAREVIFAILIYPLLVPCLISALKATAIILGGSSYLEWLGWGKILLMFNLVFLIGGLWLSGSIFGE